MGNTGLTEAESRLAELIWTHGPLASGDLVKCCESELGWKKSTTYTMLKRLEHKDLFRNDNGTVMSLLSREDFYARQSRRFVEETFQGSLPKFLAAFTRSRRLSGREIDEFQKLIDEHKED